MYMPTGTIIFKESSALRLEHPPVLFIPQTYVSVDSEICKEVTITVFIMQSERMRGGDNTPSLFWRIPAGVLWLTSLNVSSNKKLSK